MLSRPSFGVITRVALAKADSSQEEETLTSDVFNFL